MKKLIFLLLFAIGSTMYSKAYNPSGTYYGSSSVMYKHEEQWPNNITQEVGIYSIENSSNLAEIISYINDNGKYRVKVLQVYASANQVKQDCKSCNINYGLSIYEIKTKAYSRNGGSAYTSIVW